MASEVDTCNLALARLGDPATVSSINPPEGSAQAEHCARFYPIARDAALEAHSWSFATRREALPLLDVDSWGWSFAYGLPTNTLIALAVLPPGTTGDEMTQDFEIESTATGAKVLYTNQDDATLRYVMRATNTSRFSPGFVEALSWLLASYLAGPLLKGEEGASMAQATYQQYRMALSWATVADANQRQVELDHQPTWISKR
jgi:hypothetical protein